MATGDPPIDFSVPGWNRVFASDRTFPYPIVSNEVPPMRSTVTEIEPSALDAIVEKLWGKLMDVPVLVVCAYCDTINAVTNGTCLGCNGPLSKAKKYEQPPA